MHHFLHRRHKYKVRLQKRELDQSLFISWDIFSLLVKKTHCFEYYLYSDWSIQNNLPIHLYLKENKKTSHNVPWQNVLLKSLELEIQGPWCLALYSRFFNSSKKHTIWGSKIVHFLNYLSCKFKKNHVTMRLGQSHDLQNFGLLDPTKRISTHCWIWLSWTVPHRRAHKKGLNKFFASFMFVGHGEVGYWWFWRDRLSKDVAQKSLPHEKGEQWTWDWIKISYHILSGAMTH